MTSSSDAPKDRPEPLPLVEAPAAEPCPNCGKPLPGGDAVLCPACGYDLVAMRTHRTTIRDESRRVREPARDEVVGPVAERPPLVAARSVRMPVALAGAALLGMAVAFVLGAPGLFPRVDGLFRGPDGAFVLEAPSWSERGIELLRFVLRSAVLWLAATGAIVAIARLGRRRIGSGATVLARGAAIVLLAELPLLVEIDHRGAEMAVQFGLGCLVFAGLVMLWFRFRAIEALQALGLAMILGAAIHGLAWLVWWAS